MELSELQAIVAQKFRATNFIDLTQNTGITINGVPELEKFFLGSGETLTEIVSRGMASFRPGCYQLNKSPFYKDDLQFPTYAAEVLYFNDFDDKLIKYVANIGPLTNKLTTCKRDPAGFFSQYKLDRFTDNPENYFRASKGRFYDKIFQHNKWFAVEQAGFSARESNFKEAVWMFIN